MNRHVLLIEDEPNIVEAIRFVLSRDGWRVSSHADGATAHAEVARIAPDAVILDVMLPNRSGFDVLHAIRGDPGLRDLPVLVLTAKGQAKDRDRAAQLGASHFVTKPFSNADLRDTLRRMVDDGTA